MSKIFKNIVFSLLFAVILYSCGTTTKIHKNTPFTPDRTELRINVSDLKYLGESEITLSYYKYIGLFTVIDSINGVAYDPTSVKYTTIQGINSSLFFNMREKKALYKVVEDYPDATYYQVVYNRKEIDRQFLGGLAVKQTILIKAYALRVGAN